MHTSLAAFPLQPLQYKQGFQYIIPCDKYEERTVYITEKGMMECNRRGKINNNQLKKSDGCMPIDVTLFQLLAAIGIMPPDVWTGIC